MQPRDFPWKCDLRAWKVAVKKVGTDKIRKYRKVEGSVRGCSLKHIATFDFTRVHSVVWFRFRIKGNQTIGWKDKLGSQRLYTEHF